MAEVVYLGLGPIQNPPDSVTPPNDVAQILPANLRESAAVQLGGPVLAPTNPDVRFFVAASQGGQAIGPVLTFDLGNDAEVGVTFVPNPTASDFETLLVSSGTIPVANSDVGLFVQSSVFPRSLSPATGFVAIGATIGSGSPSAVIRVTPTLEIVLG